MNDWKDFRQAMKENRATEKVDTMQQNMDILHESDLEFKFNQQSRVVMVRWQGVSADFYPSSNKWKDNRKGQVIHRGDANQFIQWVVNQ